MERILKTLYWTAMYGVVWELVEMIIDGNITNRPVDCIIMMMFIPMVYRAMRG